MPGLVDLNAFRAGYRAGKPPEGGVLRVQTGAIKAVDDGRRAIRYCFSDGSVDRAGDTIAPKGWRLDGFLKNPVALWAHDSYSPPIGKASHLVIEDAKLMGDIEFAPPELYAFADTIYRLCREKFINAVSVGFLPIEYSWSNEDDRQFGLDFEEQELLEISVVPVPCNANALAEARAKGIDTGPLVEWAEKLLDGGGRIIVPKAELEQLRIAAKGPSMSIQRGKPGAQRREENSTSETDPSGGGFALNCGRKDDEECSAADPEQCSVHGPALKSGKGVGTLIRREVQAALKPIAEALKTLAGKRREAGEGESDGDEDPLGHLDKAAAHHKDAGDALDAAPDRDEEPEEHDKCVRTAHAHVKAADEYLESYRRSVGMDDHDVDTGGNPEAEKAARLLRAQQLRTTAT